MILFIFLFYLSNGATNRMTNTIGQYRNGYCIHGRADCIYKYCNHKRVPQHNERTLEKRILQLERQNSKLQKILEQVAQTSRIHKNTMQITVQSWISDLNQLITNKENNVIAEIHQELYSSLV